MQYSDPNFKNIAAQHLNNIKFILASIAWNHCFSESLDQKNVFQILMILNQKFNIKQSWPWNIEIFRIFNVENEQIVNYLFKISKDFMDDQLVRELLLLSMDSSLATRVYSRLESEFDSYPLVENAEIQGYAGLMALQESKNHAALQESHSRKARLHLEKSLKLLPLSLFEHYYLDLLNFKDSLKVYKEYLDSAFRTRSNDLNIARRLFLSSDLDRHGMVIDDGEEIEEEWITIANQVLLLNPVERYTDSLKKLVFFYEKRNVQKAIGYLVDRLDYNSGEIWMWSKLIELLKDSNYDFGDRIKWWPQIHFNPISSTLDWSQEPVLIVLVIACLFISPQSYGNSLLKVKIQGYKPFSDESKRILGEYLGSNVAI